MQGGDEFGSRLLWDTLNAALLHLKTSVWKQKKNNKCTGNSSLQTENKVFNYKVANKQWINKVSKEFYKILSFHFSYPIIMGMVFLPFLEYLWHFVSISFHEWIFHRVLRSAATHEVRDASRIFHHEAPVSAHKKVPFGAGRAVSPGHTHAACAQARLRAQAAAGLNDHHRNFRADGSGRAQSRCRSQLQRSTSGEGAGPSEPNQRGLL